MSLYPLLFGNRIATKFDNANAFADRIEKVFPGLNAYESIGTDKNFIAKSANLNLKNLSILSSSISSSIVDRSGEQKTTLMIPIYGKCQINIDGDVFNWGAHHAGMFVPEFLGRTVGSGSDRSMVHFQINEGVLNKTANIMFGNLDISNNIMRLDIPRIIPLKQNDFHLSLFVKGLGNLIDSFECNPNSLMTILFEDLVYRQLVNILIYDNKNSEITNVERMLTDSVNLDSLCDMLLSDLQRSWTLTEMEQITHLSARALQYSFNKRFNASPMVWLREQRLLFARKRLQNGDFESITQLAMDCGFGTSSQLSHYYKKRFGITPTQEYFKMKI